MEHIFVALLRGINVGGRNKIAMQELKGLCTDLGWGDVRTYIQSGNIVFRSGDEAVRLAADLEEAITDRWQLSVPVIVRTADDWALFAQNNPFFDEAAEHSNLVMLALAKGPPQPEAETMLQSRASPNERVQSVGDALWIYFGDGVARSKLSPAFIDRAVGSPVTTRNWRTVLKIHELLHDV